MIRFAVKSGSRESIQNTRDAIRNREEFKTSGALLGSPSFITRGELVGEVLEQFDWDMDANRIDYVVYSYSTPIAWHLTSGVWRVSALKHSVTSTAHQSAVVAALRGIPYDLVGE